MHIGAEIENSVPSSDSGLICCVHFYTNDLGKCMNHSLILPPAMV